MNEFGNDQGFEVEKQKRHEFVFSILREIEGLLGRDLPLTSRAELTAFILGAKPVFDLPLPLSKELSSFQDVLETNGVSCQTVGNFLVNVPLLQQRVIDDPDLAKMVGWDTGKNVEENFRQNLQKDNPHRHAFFGFLMGFPGSALRGFEHAKSLRGKYPTLTSFTSPQGFEGLMRLSKKSWEPQDIAKVYELQERCRAQKDSSEFRDSIEPELRILYRKYFFTEPDPVKDKDMEFLLSARLIGLETEAGGQIQHFGVWRVPYGGEQAEDVQRGIANIKERFAAAGFVAQLDE